MKRFKNLLAALVVASLGVFVLTPVSTVGALDPLESVCKTNGGAICDNKDDDGKTLIADIVSTLLFIVGAISVVMIIFSGILYATSSGDAGKVARAKNTLTYSIVGLVVAFIAFAIVTWVVAQIAPATPPTP